MKIGCDGNGGDYEQNGFTTKGLGPLVTSDVLDKGTRALTITARFVEQVMLADKEGKAHTTSACDKLRNAIVCDSTTTFKKNNKHKNKKSRIPANVAGPLFHPGTSLQKSLLELESYHTTCCEEELVRYWKESREEGGGILPGIQAAAVKSHNRATKRRIALHHATKTVENAEALLQRRKNDFATCAEKVEDTKNAAKARWLEIKKDRIHEMEIQKLEQNVGEVTFKDGEKENLWEMIQSVGEQSMDFVPTASTTTAANVKKDEKVEEKVEFEDTLPPLPTLAEIESEMDLFLYKNLALDAENAVEDASASLLNALSSLDTTYRSSRIAAESCLLAAAHAQKKCLQHLVQMERESLEQRLIHLQKVEIAVDKLDVRKDLNICLGSEEEREEFSEEDGGVASSMATINCYSTENRATRSDEERKEEGPIAVAKKDSTLLEGWGESGDGHDEGEGESSEEEHTAMSQTEIQDLTNIFFQEEINSEEELQNAVESLEQEVQSSSQSSRRAYKAGICHALNLKRSTQTQIHTSLQFDALSKVLHAVLSSSDCTNMDDVSNAKTCMMMAQTFYKLDDDDGEDDNNNEQRNNRIYLKTNLISNSLWSKDSFWDQALFQLVSESLIKSGVMESFSTASNGSSNTSNTKKILKWHDLTSKQRMEAASQLHALIFSQLGALAHSMMEFGCSVDMTCVFVRQMSIRHQLPISQRIVLLQHVLGKNDGGVVVNSTPLKEKIKEKTSDDIDNEIQEDTTDSKDESMTEDHVNESKQQDDKLSSDDQKENEMEET